MQEQLLTRLRCLLGDRPLQGLRFETGEGP